MMDPAIVDTKVVSMIFKGDSRAPRYRLLTDGRLLAISFMTLAELELWPLERRCDEMRSSTHVG
jgi:predicted nucleic acid-binding protein